MWALDEDIFSISMSKNPSVYYPSPRVPDPLRMDTMPASHLVDDFKLEYSGHVFKEFESKGYKFTGFAPTGTCRCNINKEVLGVQLDGWKRREPDKFRLYRDFSTRFAISSKAGVENDRQLKILKWNNSFSPAVAKLIEWLPDNTGYEMARYWVEKYVEAAAYDDHTKEFVKAHATSHPAPGITWAEVLKFGLMHRLWDFTQTVAEKWIEDFDMPGNWCLDQQSIHFGNRQRSPKVPFRSRFDWEAERCRQIGYVTGISSLNAFVKHSVKVKVLRYIFDVYEDLLDCKIICPKTEGGSIYTDLQDLFLAGNYLMHYDVSGMELITPSIIHKRIGHFNFGIGAVVGYMGGIPELLSGVSPTSDYDMIAHLELLRKFLADNNLKPILIVILGDDCTIVLESNQKVPEHPLYERQVADDAIQRTLGLTTSEWMHPVGLNVTIDRADKRIPLRDNWGRLIRNSMVLQERFDIAEFFTGSLRGVPVSEVIRKAPAVANIYSPKELLFHWVIGDRD